YHCFSINLPAAAISGEIGGYYDLRWSRKIGFQVAYGHRFYNVNFILNGGEGSGILYHPQQADVFRLGLKRYFTFKNIDVPSTYLLFRTAYWQLHTPTYIVRHGSNGLNTTPREVISVDKYDANLGFGIGKELFFKKHFFVDAFVSLGFCVGEKKIHQYYYGDSNPYRYKYPDHTFQKKLSFFPTIELGLRLGFFI